MNNIKITNPTLEDIPTLWKWGQENWQMWGDEKNKWFSKESLLKELKNSGDDVLLVARDGDRLVGMCLVNVMQNWSFCCGLFIEESYRGKGIGKKLLYHAEKQLEKKGVTSYSLLVDTKNPDAVRFYKREGFYQGYKFFMMTKDIKEKK